MTGIDSVGAGLGVLPRALAAALVASAVVKSINGGILPPAVKAMASLSLAIGSGVGVVSALTLFEGRTLVDAAELIGSA